MVQGRSDAKVGGKIRYGMVGGGQGAFIGAVHRLAARMDDNYELVAGALSSDRKRALASAKELNLDPDRSYASYEEMAKAEAKRPDGIEAVAIVTPNFMHAPVAAAFLKAGIHVICDKPLSLTVAEARDLVKLTRKSGKIFALTHNYTGYPMIRQMRAMIAAGDLGDIRIVQAEYAQDWLTNPIEQEGQKQASWRTDPKRSGAGALGDIGTHAYNLACFTTGLKLDSLLADVTTFVKGRGNDDNDAVLLRWKGGAKGMLWASQVAPGNENNLTLRIYGSKGGLEWSQEHPNHLRFSILGEPPRIITRGGAGSGPEAARMTRVPSGHPEGYLEGFANTYSEIAKALRAARDGKAPEAGVYYPTVEDGLVGMQFIEAAITSSKKGGVWVKV
ncbi:MAG: Gfo/Idh/MocA family oxidoreductase [Rhizobiales bacterium]|nr:Gfo/Idh/MocA family oxidoreductase [Hyphomicrobiales bacterium]